MFIFHELSQTGDRKEMESLFTNMAHNPDPQRRSLDRKLANIGTNAEMKSHRKLCNSSSEVCSTDKDLSNEDEMHKDMNEKTQHFCDCATRTCIHVKQKDKSIDRVGNSSFKSVDKSMQSKVPIVAGIESFQIEVQEVNFQRTRSVYTKSFPGIGADAKTTAAATTTANATTTATKTAMTATAETAKSIAIKSKAQFERQNVRKTSQMSMYTTELMIEKTSNEQTEVCNGHDIKARKKAQNPCRNDPLRLTLNVGGILYETFENTLSTHPDTLLGDPDRRMKYYNPRTGQYVFQRQNVSFDAILFYYQSKGILSKPQYIDRTAFEEELDFFEINTGRKPRSRLRRGRVRLRNPTRPMSFRRKPREVLNGIFNRPFSSPLSTVVALITIIITITATIACCIETLPSFRGIDSLHGEVKIAAFTIKDNLRNRNRRILSAIEIACMIFFTFDFFVRSYVARYRFRFIISRFGIIDILTLLPFCLSLLLSKSNIPKDYRKCIFLLRQLRILQVFRLARYSYGFRALLQTVSKSLSQLGSFIFVLPVMSMFFASVSFFAEDTQQADCQEPCKQLRSISDWFWYSVITISTVGYGDVYPRTILGKLIGSVCALFGVILFCLLTPIIFRHFVENYYVRELMSQNISKEKRKLAEKVREMYYEQYEIS